MNTNHSSSEESGEASAKRTYEKPEFRFEEVFVTSALSCTKQPGGAGTCRFGPKKVS
jgi:hypothetical protein